MSRRGALLFVAMCVIWGIPYLLIKVAVREVTPVQLVFMRTAIGTMVLLPVAAARRELRPALARWPALVAYTMVELAIPWFLLSTAEQRLPSSLAGLLVAAVPLVGSVLSRPFGDRDRLGARGILGLFVGLGGVALLVGFDVSGADIGSAALVAVVAVGYAVGPLILSRRFSDLPGLGVVAGSLVLCALGYAPLALTDLPAALPGGRVLAALAVLGVVCTALAFVLFFQLIAEIGPVRATVITYVNPAVAVVLGVVLLHEPFGLTTAAGFALILTGSFLATTPAPGREAVAAAAPIPEP